MLKFIEVVIVATIAAAIGGVLAIASTPVPSIKKDCELYTVEKRGDISYALRAPPAPAPIEHVVVKEVCPQVTKLPEIESKPEATNADERQRRRHRRHRRYWR